MLEQLSETGFPDELPPHLAESCLATSGELGSRDAWLNHVDLLHCGDPWRIPWIHAGFPFHFRLGDKETADLLAEIPRDTRVEFQEGGTCVARSYWPDDATGLRTAWDRRTYGDTPAVEWTLRFENTNSDREIVVEDIRPLRLRLRATRPDLPFAVHGAQGGRSERDDLTPFAVLLGAGAERDSFKLGVPYDASREERMVFPPSNTHMPFFNIETPDGRGFVIGLGTLGRWKAGFRVEGDTLEVSVENEPITLAPGEEARTHRVLLLLWEGKPLHGHNMFRRALRERYVPELRGEPMLPRVSVNTAFTHHGKGHFLTDANEANLLPLVQPFADLGAELFVVDAGWNTDSESWGDGMNGDWTPVPSKYPKGFRRLAEELRRHDMGLGVWFATAHNLDRARFLRQFGERVEQGMTCYRHDMKSHDVKLLSLWDELWGEFPDLVWEGCCGGGRSIDLESVSRFHWHQKSDRWGDIESDQCSLYGGNLYLPGGSLNVPTYYTDDYGAWSSFAGQLCLGWHPLDDDFPFEQARCQVELYKRVRPLLRGDFYPLTPCSLTAPWLGYQFHRPDTDSGFALLFRRDVDGPDTFGLKLRGLAPGRRYRLGLEAAGTEKTHDAEALSEGLRVAVTRRPSAELAIYEPEAE